MVVSRCFAVIFMKRTLTRTFVNHQRLCLPEIERTLRTFYFWCWPESQSCDVHLKISYGCNKEWLFWATWSMCGRWIACWWCAHHSGDLCTLRSCISRVRDMFLFGCELGTATITRLDHNIDNDYTPSQGIYTLCEAYVVAISAFICNYLHNVHLVTSLILATINHNIRRDTHTVHTPHIKILWRSYRLSIHKLMYFHVFVSVI